jgi:hypothetical protein
LNNKRCEASRYFRKKTAYPEANIEKLESNIKIENIRDFYSDINDFKKSNQGRTNIVKDEKGDSFIELYSILARCNNHFSHLSNLHEVSNVRRTEIHTAESLLAKMSAFVVEMAITRIKGHKSPGLDQIPAELINF